MSTNKSLQPQSNTASFFSTLAKVTIVPFLLIAGRLIVYILSFAGFGLSIIYFVFWVIFPKKTPCILCRIGKEGDKCPFCNEEIKPSTFYPKNLKSAFLNVLVIVLLTFLSLGLLYLENQILAASDLVTPKSNVNFIVDSKAHHKKGEVFSMGINVSKTDTSINAVQMDLKFDPNKLEIVDITTTGSFVNIFLQKEIDNQLGFARIAGGLPNPGYIPNKSNFCTIIFKAKDSGLAEISFLDSSKVLANDGRGTDILNTYKKTYYLITDDDITPDESKAGEKY